LSITHEEIEELERRIEMLRRRYDRYFSGREKREPLMDRFYVDAMAHRMNSEYVPNKGLKYFLESVSTKLTSYHGFWNRMMKRIEEGTIKREVDKSAQILQDQAIKRQQEKLGENYIGMNEYLDGSMDDELHKAAMEALEDKADEFAGGFGDIPGGENGRPSAIPALRPDPSPAMENAQAGGGPAATQPSGPFTPIQPPQSQPAELSSVPPADGRPSGIPIALASRPPSQGPFASRPASEGAPPVSRPPLRSVPPVASPPQQNQGLPDQRVSELYNAFMMARRTLGEPPSTLTLDGFKKQISQQVPVLQKKYNTSKVDFKVSIKGGKASIKAVVGGDD
jgi:hypothetical protein